MHTAHTIQLQLDHSILGDRKGWPARMLHQRFPQRDEGVVCVRSPFGDDHTQQQLPEHRAVVDVACNHISSISCTTVDLDVIDKREGCIVLHSWEDLSQYIKHLRPWLRCAEFVQKWLAKLPELMACDFFDRTKVPTLQVSPISCVFLHYPMLSLMHEGRQQEREPSQHGAEVKSKVVLRPNSTISIGYRVEPQVSQDGSSQGIS
jgi:hypothetical protein